MAHNLRSLAALAVIGLTVASVDAGQAGKPDVRALDDRATDLQPLMPIARANIFNFRNYGPQDNHFALSPDGQHAVSANGGALMIYDLSRQRRDQPPRQLVVDGANFYRSGIAFTPDGKTVVAVPNSYPEMSLRFLDIASGKEIRQIDNDQNYGSLAVSPNGKVLALGTNQKIELWDAATSDEIRVLHGHQNSYYQVLAFSPDGKMLASAANDGTVQVWETNTGQVRLSVRLGLEAPMQNFQFAPMPGFGTVSALAFSADNAILAAGASDQAIHLLDLRTGKELPPLVGHQASVGALVFTANSKRLLSLDNQGLKLDWDARRLGKEGNGKLRTLDDGEFADLWEDLAEGDAFRTYRAIRHLAADPKRALPVLAKRLQPVPAGDPKEIARLVADLQNQNASLRRKAMAGLRKQGEAALGALNQIPQFQRNFQAINIMINRMERLYSTGDRLRSLKAVQALERIGSAEARQLLEKLSKGAAGARLTVAAKAALDQLAERPAQAQAAAIEPQTLWADLASDAPKAYRAIMSLAAHPDNALPFLGARMKPVPSADAKRVDRLVADLDSGNFATRQKAMTELEKLGEAVVPDLKKALAGKLSLEVHKRVEQLVDKTARHGLSSEQLRQLRALEVLERMASPESRQVLQTLARGAPLARLTQEARECLERLEKRLGS